MNHSGRIQLVLTYKHDAEDEEIFTEAVDAERVGDYYKLLQIPAFAKNLAYGDIVKVEYDEGKYHFDELIEESGFSTVHIVIFKPESKDGVVNFLSQSGCGVNSQVADNYLVISIPPSVVYQPIQFYLQSQKDSQDIDFRESCLSRLHSTNRD